MCFFSPIEDSNTLTSIAIYILVYPNYCLKNCINVQNVHHTGLINFELKATTQSADYTQMVIQ